MPVEDSGQVRQRNVRHPWTVVVLDLIEQLHDFRSLDFIDLVAGDFLRIDQSLEGLEPFLCRAELAAERRLAIGGVARHPTFAGQVLLTDGLQRGGGRGFCLPACFFSFSAFLAFLLDRVFPSFDVAGKLSGFFARLIERQAGIAPVDPGCPRLPPVDQEVGGSSPPSCTNCQDKSAY